MSEKFNRLTYLTAEVIDFERRTRRRLPNAHVRIAVGDFDGALHALAEARRNELASREAHHLLDLEELELDLNNAREPEDVEAIQGHISRMVREYGSSSDTLAVINAALGD